MRVGWNLFCCFSNFGGKPCIDFLCETDLRVIEWKNFSPAQKSLAFGWLNSVHNNAGILKTDLGQHNKAWALKRQGGIKKRIRINETKREWDIFKFLMPRSSSFVPYRNPLNLVTSCLSWFDIVELKIANISILKWLKLLNLAGKCPILSVHFIWFCSPIPIWRIPFR